MVEALREAPFSLRNRRVPAVATQAHDLGPSRFALDVLLQAQPGTPAVTPSPFGDLRRSGSDELIKVAVECVGSMQSDQVGKRRRGTRKLVMHLSQFGGDDWQSRWLASGLDGAQFPISALGMEKWERCEWMAGLQALFCMRVITPSLGAFRSNKLLRYPEYFRATQADAGLDQFFQAVAGSGAPPRFQRAAQLDISSLMTTQGLNFGDVTPEALLHYALERRRLGAALGAGERRNTTFDGVLAWDVLFNLGHFPSDTPASLRERLYAGQRSPEQMVAHYGIKHPDLQELFVAYLTRRQADTDYNTRKQMALILLGNFWNNIERINPNQSHLHLADETYQQWIETIRLRKDGRKRTDINSILLPVRALYLDIHSWALAEPEQWAKWVAPCPITPADLRGFADHRRRIKERMDDRTRVRQPLLPLLAEHVDNRLSQLTALLTTAATVEPGMGFELDGKRYRRMNTDTDQRNRAAGHDTVRVVCESTLEVMDLRAAEESAFWDWAYVEILRLTGLRVEELVELSHTSLRQYQRPSGEVVALLVVAPSKANRERVMPVSPELFAVLASVVRRQSSTGAIPSVPRYDAGKATWTAPLPYLFQRQVGGLRRVVSTATVLLALRACCERLAVTVPAFRNVHFTPHDFRRLFATDLVNNGLPIHIGAALLGHLSIETTRGYTAVFEEDVVRHYQEFLATRRARRPQEEYRPATEMEWSEFEEHFDKRKVELGSCGRPYGTPCQHEHSCIRCPMLHVNPKMIERLNEIEEDLLNRRDRALENGWTGEVEGLDLTLRFLTDKREESQRLSKTTRQIGLAAPTVRTL